VNIVPKGGQKNVNPGHISSREVQATSLFWKTDEGVK